MDIRQVYWHTEDHREMEEDPFAYCSLCGGRLAQEIVDNRGRKVCPDCGYIHFRNPAPTVSLLIMQGVSFAIMVWFFRVVMSVASQWMMYVIPAPCLLYTTAAGLGEMLVLGVLYGLTLRPAI